MDVSSTCWCPPPSLSHHDFQKADFFVGHSVLFKRSKPFNSSSPLNGKHKTLLMDKSCTTKDDDYPKKQKKALTIPGGAGFLPSKRSQQTPKVDFIPPGWIFVAEKPLKKKR